jgi:hypothetical protein
MRNMHYNMNWEAGGGQPREQPPGEHKYFYTLSDFMIEIPFGFEHWTRTFVDRIAFSQVHRAILTYERRGGAVN